MDIFDRRRILSHFEGSDERLLFAKALEQAHFCLENGEDSFSGFTDPVRLGKYFGVFSKCVNAPEMSVFGGYDGAERKRIGFFAGEISGYFEISLLRLTLRSGLSGGLSHRSVLGSLTGLDIDRAYIGDIAIFSDKAFAFMDSEKAAVAERSLTKAGTCAVDAEIVPLDELLPVFWDYAEKIFVLGSLRLDGFTSAVFGLSREKAKNAVETGKILVNWKKPRSRVTEIHVGETVTFRGMGRAEVMRTEQKGGKLAVTVRLYIS